VPRLSSIGCRPHGQAASGKFPSARVVQARSDEGGFGVRDPAARSVCDRAQRNTRRGAGLAIHGQENTTTTTAMSICRTWNHPPIGITPEMWRDGVGTVKIRAIFTRGARLVLPGPGGDVLDGEFAARPLWVP